MTRVRISIEAGEIVHNTSLRLLSCSLVERMRKSQRCTIRWSRDSGYRLVKLWENSSKEPLHFTRTTSGTVDGKAVGYLGSFGITYPSIVAKSCLLST
jgi:hypothetical protein